MSDLPPDSMAPASGQTLDGVELESITSLHDFLREFFIESKKIWYIGGPSVLLSVCQYSLGAITQIFAGQVGTLELAAISISNSVIAGLSFGFLLGMGSALETLCGQAFGAKQLDMLGVYMQRSWVILNITALFLSLYYIFATSFLELIGQRTAISKAAGTFAIYQLPQLFAYAMTLPMAKFLQAQSKIMAMSLISVVVLGLHVLFSWLLMLKLRWGLAGAAVVLDLSWWFIVAGQLMYILSGRCGQAWTGFSWKAFQNIWGFFRLSLASAVMICLEVWYLMILILFAGYLKNAEVSVNALSICMNILAWTIMFAFGLNIAVSVRVGNELGAGHPKRARFSVVVIAIIAFLCGLVISLILIGFRSQYPALFSSNPEVRQLVSELTPLLAVNIVVNTVQPALSGVAIGAGWQVCVAYMNIGCYYIIGIPLGLVLGYKLSYGVKGIWYGMMTGTIVQTSALFLMIYKTNWNKEANLTKARIRQWGGPEDIQDDRQ